MTKIEPIGIGGLHRGLSIPEIYIENNKLNQENKQLKKQKDDVVEYIKNLIKRLDEFNILERKETGAFWYQVMGELKEILRMLGEIDNE